MIAILLLAPALPAATILCAWLGLRLFRARGGHETLGLSSRAAWLPVFVLLAALPALVTAGFLAWQGAVLVGLGCALAGYALAYGGTSLGHGSAFDQGTNPEGWKDRKEIPVDWIVGQQTEAMTAAQTIARDRAAAAWRVLFITLGPGLAIVAAGLLEGLWALLPVGALYGASGWPAGRQAALWARRGVDEPEWWWRTVGRIGLKPDRGFNPPFEATEAMVGLLVGAAAGAAAVAVVAAAILA